MRVFAEYFKENGLTFRTNTILQFGDSWELIGNIVLANPGSAEPIESLCDDSRKKLKNFYKNYKVGNDFKTENWHEFSPDQTMHRIKKIFNGEYIGNNKNLNGVIQLFNTFNIKNQYLEDAIKQIDIKSDLLFSLGIEKYFHNKPTYYGFSNDILNNEILRPIAKSIFDNSSDEIRKLYKDNFDENKFYHPTYINRAINQDHFKWYKESILTEISKLIN